MPDNPVLSVICPAHTDRHPSLLVSQLKEQMARANRSEPVVEFLCLLDNGPLSTGKKLNLLYSLASGAYIAGVGDDDVIGPDYVERLVSAIREHDGVDVISFDHLYYVDGCYTALTCVSKDLTDSQTADVHNRKPTPKCAIRADICKRFVCPDISDREDIAMVEWLATQLETEHKIEGWPPIYTHCWNRTNKQWRKDQAAFWGRR